MKRVIATVGTSIFKNYLDMRTDIQNHYQRIEKARVNDWNLLLERINFVHKAVAAWAKEKDNASAEIKSLWKIQEQTQEELKVHLVCTETVLSRLAAEIIAEYFNNQPNKLITINFDHKQDVISGLQVEDLRRFEQEGIVNLVKRFYDLAGGYMSNLVLNITGGYKGMIPYLTLLGQINNVPIYYIFEDTDELIKIPQAPVSIDRGLFAKYNQVFQELSQGVEESWDNFRRTRNIQDDFKDCIYEVDVDGKPLIGLNAVGEMFWLEHQRFSIVYIPLGSKYWSEEFTNKKQLEKAIQELLRRLAKITEPLATLTDKDLKHAVIQDTFVYKHSNPQIRIQYKYKDNNLYIYNYFFINSEEIDKNYSKYMIEQYENLRRQKLDPVPFDIPTVI